MRRTGWNESPDCGSAFLKLSGTISDHLWRTLHTRKCQAWCQLFYAESFPLISITILWMPIISIPACKRRKLKLSYRTFPEFHNPDEEDLKARLANHCCPCSSKSLETWYTHDLQGGLSLHTVRRTLRSLPAKEALWLCLSQYSSSLYDSRGLFFFLFSFFSLGPHPRHMEVPRLGGKS